MLLGISENLDVHRDSSPLPCCFASHFTYFETKRRDGGAIRSPQPYHRKMIKEI